MIVAAGSGVIAWLQLRRAPKRSHGSPIHDPAQLHKSKVSSIGFLQAPSGRLPEHVRGRDTLLVTLSETVRRPDGNVHVITGMGGVGKSAVALKIAEYAVKIGQEAWWVASSKTSPLTSTLLGLARYLGASPIEVEECLAGIRNSSDLLWQYLERRHHWVLIIDNADDIDEFTIGSRLAKDGNGWLRSTKNGLLVVTSRSSDPSRWGSHIRMHKLNVLSNSESAQVLLDLAPEGGSQESACQLAAKLGGLPLALRHAGLYLAQPFVAEHTFDAYLSKFIHNMTELMPSHLNAQEDERSLLRSTWDLSLSVLERQRIVDARRIFRLLCVFSAPDPIPLIPIQTAVQKSILPRNVLAETLPALENMGLFASQEVEPHSEKELAPDKAITLHPLVAEGVCSDSTTDEIAIAISLLAKIISAAILELDRSNPTTWPVWVMLVPHLSQVLANPITRSLGEDSVNELLHSCARVVSTLAIASEHPKSEDLVEQIRPYVALFPTVSIVSITARYCIAHANRTRSFSIAGEDEFREILDLQVRLLGKAHPDSLHSRHNLAHTLAANGRLDEAITQFKETIDLRTRVLGPTTDVTLSSRRALLFWLIRAGRAAEAKQQLDALAHLTVNLWSADYPAALSLRCSAAAIRIIEHDIDGLDKELNDILKQQTKVIGEGHEETLVTRMALADVYELQGKLFKAKEQLSIVLSHRQRLLGPDHPIVQALQNRLSSTSLSGRQSSK